MTDHAPLRVVQVGAGGMGRAWLGTVAADPDVELVGIVDLDLDAARSGAELAGAPTIAVGRDLPALLADTGAEAVLDITVPVAHHPVTMDALHAGLPVLGEKPAAQTVAEALSSPPPPRRPASCSWCRSRAGTTTSSSRSDSTSARSAGSAA